MSNSVKIVLIIVVALLALAVLCSCTTICLAAISHAG